jgi:hypothetical protein
MMMDLSDIGIPTTPTSRAVQVSKPDSSEGIFAGDVLLVEWRQPKLGELVTAWRHSKQGEPIYETRVSRVVTETAEPVNVVVGLIRGL